MNPDCRHTFVYLQTCFRPRPSLAMPSYEGDPLDPSPNYRPPARVVHHTPTRRRSWTEQRASAPAPSPLHSRPDFPHPPAACSSSASWLPAIAVPAATTPNFSQNCSSLLHHNPLPPTDPRHQCSAHPPTPPPASCCDCPASRRLSPPPHLAHFHPSTLALYHPTPLSCSSLTCSSFHHLPGPDTVRVAAQIRSSLV
jgi:hypothetical protein